MFHNCTECFDARDPSDVIILTCGHCFCPGCLEKYLLSNLEKYIKCPVASCEGEVNNQQIRAILSDEDLLIYNAKFLEGLPRLHKCLLPQCNNVVQYPEDTVNYTCDKCSLCNCIQCDAGHESITCDTYRSLSSEQKRWTCQAAIEKAKEKFHEKTRQALFEATKLDLFKNDRIFECFLCSYYIGKGKGIKLRTCYDNICRPCLIRYIKNSNSMPLKCPHQSCNSIIEDREVKAILTEAEFEIYERKGINRVKNKLINAFQCQQANCDYLCELENMKITKFKCPKCSTKNCVKCYAVHRGEKCKTYKKRLNKNEDAVKELIKQGKCMECPDCQNLVTKSSGCNSIKCSKCDLELCWILKMRRWGPKGRGDTSAGCKCDIGNYCHPDCMGCFQDY